VPREDQVSVLEEFYHCRKIFWAVGSFGEDQRLWNLKLNAVVALWACSLFPSKKDPEQWS
jgi:hypothetical protein